jgi:tetratricopeptide (TPR) repeat protein
MTWVVVTLLGAMAPSGAAGQILPGEIERDHIQSELRRYHALILDYRRGSTDAVEGILPWDRKRIHRVLAAIETANDEIRPWGTIRFKAATMMHTDVALRLVERSNMDAALLHIDTASQLLKKAGPGARPYAGRWYQAVSRLFRSGNALAVAERFLETGRERLPHDPTILYESGTLQELLATDTLVPIIVALPAPDLRAPPPNTDTGAVGSAVSLAREDVDDLTRRRAERLNRAAGWLHESLQGDPLNILARLHLGRVQTLRRRSDDALKLLQEAAASEDAATAYLAILFTGALHERQGRMDAAAHAYRTGIERFPLNHAAHIALSAVLQRSGRWDESRDVLRRVVDAAAASRREPWWSYFVEPSNVNLARLDLLRREARQ